MSRTVRQERFSIGRGAENDWILPDPGRLLSKRHCVVEYGGGGYFITDESTNGVFVNHGTHPIGRGSSVALNDGDMVKLGSYEFSIRIEADTEAIRKDSVGSPLPDFAAGQLLDSPLLDSGGPLFAPLQEEYPLGPGPAEPVWQGSSQADHGPSDVDFLNLPVPTRQSIPETWFEDLMAGPASSPTVPQPDPERIPEYSPAVLPVLPAPVEDVSARPGTESALLDAFLKGAGLSRSDLMDSADDQVTLRRCGELYRESIEGVQEILKARAMVKSEFRMEQTMFQATRNNPLKVLPDLNEILATLLREKDQFYMTGREAVTNATKDIIAHELAILTAIQVALHGLLDDFSPEKLTKRVEGTSFLENLLPSARKARYWDIYAEFYSKISRDIESDFHNAFGRAMAETYDQELRK